MAWLVSLLPVSSLQPLPLQPITKLPAELPQLNVRVVPPNVPSEQENLPMAWARLVSRSEPTRIARRNRKKANLAKERLIRG